MRTIVLTAFEPFGGESLNPSLDTGRAIAKSGIDGVRVQFLELPVDRERAFEAVASTLREGADAAIMLGEAGGRYRVTPERVAINVDDFRIPDNAGNQPSDEPIVEGGPAAYFSTLPIRAIVNRLLEKQIPAAVSNSAGTYLCNRLFYSAMHLISSESLNMRAGFIHLPYLHEQAASKQVDMPSLSREVMVEAVRTAIDVTLLTTDDR